MNIFLHGSRVSPIISSPYNGGAGGTRTHDLWFFRPAHLPTELQHRLFFDFKNNKKYKNNYRGTYRTRTCVSPLSGQLYLKNSCDSIPRVYKELPTIYHESIVFFLCSHFRLLTLLQLS